MCFIRYVTDNLSLVHFATYFIIEMNLVISLLSKVSLQTTHCPMWPMVIIFEDHQNESFIYQRFQVRINSNEILLYFKESSMKTSNQNESKISHSKRHEMAIIESKNKSK